MRFCRLHHFLLSVQQWLYGFFIAPLGCGIPGTLDHPPSHGPALARVMYGRRKIAPPGPLFSPSRCRFGVSMRPSTGDDLPYARPQHFENPAGGGVPIRLPSGLPPIIKSPTNQGWNIHNQRLKSVKGISPPFSTSILFSEHMYIEYPAVGQKSRPISENRSWEKLPFCCYAG